MSLSFKDDESLSLWRKEMFIPGSLIGYGDHWRLQVSGDGPSLSLTGSAPKVDVTAPSRWVERLRAQTGEVNWGRIGVSDWVRRISGTTSQLTPIRPVVQPGLGSRELVRKKPEGDRAESTWDVLVALAKELDCWCFETGDRLILGRPSWVLANAARTWNFRWSRWGDYTGGFDGQVSFSGVAREDQTFEVGLLSGDADTVRPGDRLNVSGNLGKATGTWVVSDISFPMKVAAPVKITAKRAVL